MLLQMSEERIIRTETGAITTERTPKYKWVRARNSEYKTQKTYNQSAWRTTLTSQVNCYTKMLTFIDFFFLFFS